MEPRSPLTRTQEAFIGSCPYLPTLITLDPF
jgi:hypothetical protein